MGTDQIDSELEKHLYDNFILIDSGIDEVAFASSVVKKVIDRSIILTIMPTEKCNFRCVYCYEEFPADTLLSQHYNVLFKYIVSKV